MVRVWPAGGQAVDAEPESETDAETGTDADTESDAESGTDADTESDAVTAMARIVPVRTALRRRMMNIRGWIVAITLTCEPARCMARKAWPGRQGAGCRVRWLCPWMWGGWPLRAGCGARCGHGEGR